MRTTKIKETTIGLSSPETHSVYDRNSFGAHGSNSVCPPPNKIHFTKVDFGKRKFIGGGYAAVAADEEMKDAGSGASSYNDFIRYNYGTEKEHLE